MSKPIPIGIIGAGMWGTVHTRMFQAEPRAEVRWICDPVMDRCQAVQQTYGVKNASPDYHDMLEDPAVEAVVIAAPPYLHVPMAVEALEAGKHVLVEKPMAVNREQMREMLAAAQRHPDLVVLEGSCRHSRLQPKFPFVRDLIASGKLGDVYHIHFMHLTQRTYVEYNPQADWSVDRARAGGGPLLDWGEYDLSFHLGVLADQPNLVTLDAFAIGGLRDLSGKVQRADVEQHGAALMRFDTGMTFYYERGSGVHNQSRMETRIFGTKGGLCLRYPSWEGDTIEYFYADGEPHKEELHVDMSGHPSHDNEPLVSHFIDCLEGKAEPAMPVTLAAKHLDILLRMLEARRS
ncbi:MAG: Gfo/Idh/MocA family oxidoreductase [Anaerolineae bacterium]